jgi:hypothetical protein
MPEQLPQLGWLHVVRLPVHVHNAAPDMLQDVSNSSNTLRPFII